MKSRSASFARPAEVNSPLMKSLFLSVGSTLAGRDDSEQDLCFAGRLTHQGKKQHVLSLSDERKGL